MFKEAQRITDKERKAIPQAIARAIIELQAKEGITISYQEALEIYNSQIEFIEHKIQEGSFETITLPNLVRFEVSIPRYKSFITLGSSKRIEKLKRELKFLEKFKV